MMRTTSARRARRLGLRRIGVDLAVGLGVVLALASGVARPVGAQGAESDAPRIDERDRSAGWEPRLNFGFGVLTQPLKGQASVPTQTSRAVLSDSGDSYISPHFKFGLDLLTPLQLAVPTRPRLVFRSSLQVPISRGLIGNREDSSYDRTRNPAGFADNCPATVGTPPRITSTCSVRLRNRTSIDYLWTAGIGVDFTLPFDEEQFHFTQGFDYIGMAAQAEGEYQRRSTANQFGVNETDAVDVKGDLELYHGISISEMFSVDAYEQGPLLFGLFVEGRMSWYITDRDMSVSGTSPRGSFQFVSSFNDPEPIQYQAVFGISVRFDPRRY
jgi:hypothetical protein